jgi:hypothetical protein
MFASPVLRALSLTLLLLHASAAWGQPAADEVRPVSEIASPMIADPDRYPPPPPAAAPAPWRLWHDTKLDATWLPRSGANGLGIADLELATSFTIDGWAPLTITPYAAAHDWARPTAPEAPSLPSRLYDLNVEFAWRPRLAEWLFADLALTPGLYTDFQEVHGDSFMLRGRGVAIVAFSPQLQIAAGGMYVNRNRTKFLPAGGVIWNPSEDTRLFLVFPQPKVSHRFATIGDTQLWGYLAGEFGGGRWEIERADGMAESIDYTDLRAIAGIEAAHGPRLKGHLEIGYVFNRRVNFGGDAPDFKPPSTLMLRAGLRF